SGYISSSGYSALHGVYETLPEVSYDQLSLVIYQPLVRPAVKESFYVDRFLLSATIVEDELIFLTDVTYASETEALDDQEDDDYEEICISHYEIRLQVSSDQLALVRYQPLVRFTVKKFFIVDYFLASSTTVEEDPISLGVAQDTAKIKACDDCDDDDDDDFEEICIPVNLPQVNSDAQLALVLYQPLVRVVKESFYVDRYLLASSTILEDEFIFMMDVEDTAEIKASDEEDDEFEEISGCILSSRFTTLHQIIPRAGVAPEQLALVAYQPLVRVTVKESFYVDRQLRLSSSTTAEDPIFLTDVQETAELKASDDEQDGDFENICIPVNLCKILSSVNCDARLAVVLYKPLVLSKTSSYLERFLLAPLSIVEDECIIFSDVQDTTEIKTCDDEEIYIPVSLTLRPHAPAADDLVETLVEEEPLVSTTSKDHLSVVEDVEVTEEVQVSEDLQVVAGVQVADDVHVIDNTRVIEDVQVEDTQVIAVVQVVVAEGIQAVEDARIAEVAEDVQAIEDTEDIETEISLTSNVNVVEDKASELPTVSDIEPAAAIASEDTQAKTSVTTQDDILADVKFPEASAPLATVVRVDTAPVIKQAPVTQRSIPKQEAKTTQTTIKTRPPVQSLHNTVNNTVNKPGNNKCSPPVPSSSSVVPKKTGTPSTPGSRRAPKGPEASTSSTQTTPARIPASRRRGGRGSGKTKRGISGGVLLGSPVTDDKENASAAAATADGPRDGPSRRARRRAANAAAQAQGAASGSGI
ncbi:hypothetical protein EUX98_g8233, partial [Antrodiella citrinella]